MANPTIERANLVRLLSTPNVAVVLVRTTIQGQIQVEAIGPGPLDRIRVLLSPNGTQNLIDFAPGSWWLNSTSLFSAVDNGFIDVITESSVQTGLSISLELQYIPQPPNPVIGDLLVFNGIGWDKLPAGPIGQVLTSNGPATVPSYQVSGSGSVASVTALPPLSTSGTATDPVVEFQAWPANLAGALTNDGSGALSWVPGGTGGIGGTIANTQVAFGTALDTIGGSADITWNANTLAVNSTITVVDGVNTLTLQPSAISSDAATLTLDAASTVQVGGTAGVSIGGVYTLPAVDGAAGQVLTTDGLGAASWVASSGGAPGTPLNSVQFNSAGSFGGSAGLTWDGSTLAVDGSVDRATVGTLTIGGTTANAITVGKAGVTTSFPGPVALNGTVTSVTQTQFVTAAQFDGNVTFGNAVTDNVSFVSQIDTAITQEGIAAPAVSPLTTGRIYFDSGSNKFRVSQNNGAYVDMITGGTVTSITLDTSATGLTVNGGGSASITTSGTFTIDGTLDANNGGTGIALYVVGDLLYASGTTALSTLADVATGNALISGGVGAAPSWGKIGLTTHVSDILPAANGGTGIALPGALNNVLTSDGAGGWTSSALPAGVSGSGVATQLAYFTGTSAIGSETGLGAEALTWDATNNALGVRTASPTAGAAIDIASGQLAIPDGTAAAPAIAFRDGLNNGFYSPSNDVVGIAVNGAEVARFQQSGVGNSSVMLLGTTNDIGEVTCDSSDPSGIAGVVMLAHGVAGTTSQESYRGGQFAGVRSRGTKTGVLLGPSQVGAGDGLVNVLGTGWTDGAGVLPINYGALMTMKAEEAYTAAASGGRIEFHTTLSGTSGLTFLGGATTERMRITNAGNIGIGTATPNEKLTVSGVISIAEGAAPTLPTTAFGKLWANSASDARPYWTDDTGQSYNLTLDRFNTLTYGLTPGSVAIDTSPALPVFNSLALNQDTTFTTTGLGNGRSASVRVVCDASTRTLTFPSGPTGWTWLGSGPPASLAAGDVGYLSITAYGTADTDVVAAWSSENQPAAVVGSGVDNQISIWSGTNSQDGSANLTFNGTTLGVTGGITQTGGAVSLTGNASSSLTTSSGALTLTSAVAATWSTTVGDLSLTATANSVVVTGAEAAADAITLTASNAAGGIDVNAGTGGVTIDTTAAFSIDGATASNVTVTGLAQSLTLSAAGGGAQKVLVQSAGTGVDAVDLVATAGGFSIDGVAASNVTATGADLTVSTATSGSLNLTSAAAVNVTSASNLQISANGNATTWPTAAGTSGQVLANNGAGALSWTAMPANGGLTPKLGNVLVVDAINGNDGTGTVNGPPFLTVEAAIAYINTNSLTGVTVWIMPGTYTLTSVTTGLTIPATCALRGMNTQTTKIVMTASNPGGTVTLLTMGENTRVEDISLTLNSSDATTNLVGIALPGTTSSTSKLRTAVLTVDNSGIAVGTTTNVYGILDNGTGSVGPATFSFNFTRGVTVNVFSNGGGNKRGVLVSTANDVTFRDTNFYVRAPTDSASTGSYVGVETTDPDCSAQFRTSSISGPTTAGSYTGSDIYQASPAAGYTYKGVVLGPGCDLINKTAGGKSFTTYTTPITLLYCANASLINGTHYLWPGTLPSGGDNTEVFYRFQQKAIIQGLAINCRTAPGTGNGVTVTIRRSTTGVPNSGVATSMTVSITNSTNAGTHFTSSEDFAQGEFMSVQITTPGGPGAAADLVVEIDLF